MDSNNGNSVMVSICCITYNHASYISDCINGFLMQKTTFPFEIIINDDCSTDGTTEIIKDYSSRYPNLIRPIYHEENQWSKGIKSILSTFVFPKARGKYIALCEGDDYWTDPYKLQKQVDILEQDQSLIAVVTNTSIVDSSGAILEPQKDNIVKGNVEGRYNLRDFFKDSNQYPTATVCYRNNNPEYIQHKKQITANPFFGDWDLWIILHTLGDFFYLNQVTSAYRVNPTSLTHHNFNKRREELAKANFKINKSIQSILPSEYDDIKKDLDNTTWIWFNLANAYKHSKKYILMVYALTICFIKDPSFVIDKLKKK